MITEQSFAVDFFFPGFTPETTATLHKILNFALALAEYTVGIEFPLAIAAIIMNIPHIVVLTRKSMFNNSINFILAALAMNDIFMMLVLIFKNRYLAWYLARFNSDCVPPDDLQLGFIRLAFRTLQMMCRRNSSWLAIVMSTIRTLCISFPHNNLFSSFTTIKSGLYAVLVELLTSLCISSTIPIPYLIYKPLWNPEKDKEWSQKKECTGYPILENITEHDMNYSEDDQRRTTYIDTLTINVVPSCIYPIMTFFLVRAFREANKLRKRVKRENESDRSTAIVLGMTFCFMVAEIPQALAYALKIFCAHIFGLTVIGELAMQSFANLSLLNSCTHGLICFGLSTNYRTAVYMLLRLKKATGSSSSRLTQTRTIPVVSTTNSAI